ncbi:hypothetical protein SFRURICE_003641 [Spodoptera frugiperda]|uniref:SFRICE_040206 n=1 Tax=Spodoptera frugiperda TaxID=7108 RepID=A0A2H1WZ05_SPOFR|nr:hypothetical protein SFRURICE_003641 [Spodoptera frugiperda]
MVKLPENDNRALHQEHRTEQETWEEICQHSNKYNTPMTLLELEEFAKIASHLIAPESEDNTRRRIQKAMNKLRELFNLEFKMFCEVCFTPHQQDELTAPER